MNLNIVKEQILNNLGKKVEVSVYGLRNRVNKYEGILYKTYPNMAKKQTKIKSIEETLWESANKLRGSVEPSEYKHVVLSLIFLKYANDRFEERRGELIADGKGAFLPWFRYRKRKRRKAV